MMVQLTYLTAMGELTNLAMRLRREPGFTKTNTRCLNISRQMGKFLQTCRRLYGPNTLINRTASALRAPAAGYCIRWAVQKP